MPPGNRATATRDPRCGRRGKEAATVNGTYTRQNTSGQPAQSTTNGYEEQPRPCGTGSGNTET